MAVLIRLVGAIRAIFLVGILLSVLPFLSLLSVIFYCGRSTMIGIIVTIGIRAHATFTTMSAKTTSIIVQLHSMVVTLVSIVSV